MGTMIGPTGDEVNQVWCEIIEGWHDGRRVTAGALLDVRDRIHEQDVEIERLAKRLLFLECKRSWWARLSYAFRSWWNPCGVIECTEDDIPE